MRRLVLATVAALTLAAPAAAQERTPVVGGGSFNGAPVIAPGEYRDTVLAGETLFYAVEVKAGQTLRIGARLDAEQDLIDQVVSQVAVNVIGAQRETDAFLIGEDLAGNRNTMTGASRAIEFRTPAAETFTEAGESSTRYNGPGTWYLGVVALPTTREDRLRAELPFELDVAVEGTPEPEPRPDATPAATAKPKEPAGGGGSGGGGAALAGVGLGGLLAGALLGAVLGRSRRR